MEDAHDDPRLHGRQALRFRRVGRHAVEDVHQDEEQGDEECHSTWKTKMKSFEFFRNILNQESIHQNFVLDNFPILAVKHLSLQIIYVYK